MKVAYITHQSPDDIRTWSGLNHYIRDSVARHGAEMVNVGPLFHWLRWDYRLKRKWFALTGQKMLEDREPSVIEMWADDIAKKLEQIKPDVILTTHTYYLTMVKTNIPIVVYCDANFASLLDYYPYYVGLPQKTIDRSHAWEKADLHRAKRVLYACDHAKQFAINTYGVDPAKIDVIPFGANIDCDRTEADIEDYISRRPKDRCKLLFIGKVWARKGGDIAVAVAEGLNNAGLPTTLTLMGSEPPKGRKLPDCVTKLGFINKDEPAGLKKFNDTIGESHFMIVPSRAEAFGIVFCEAASYGVPSMATATGGITAAINSGVSGETFPLEAGPQAYIDYVLDKFKNYADYEKLGRTAFIDFQTRTNWDVSGKRIYDHLVAVVEESKGR